MIFNLIKKFFVSTTIGVDMEDLSDEEVNDLTTSDEEE